uniref:UDP-galactose transporter n=1 Tax=Panagrellus redivivus TaxID=6233 RepID=A0A7E4ZTK4_PANRE
MSPKHELEKLINIGTGSSVETETSEPGSLISPNRSKVAQTVSKRALWYIHTCSLVFLTVQQTIHPLLVREAHHRASGTPIVGSTIVMVTEIMRLSLSTLHVLIQQKSFSGLFDEYKYAFFHNKKETIKVSVPALIYVVQNNLYFFALRHLDATMFSITYQLRILTTALLSVIILKRVFSGQQWFALFISLMGVICVQMSSSKSDATEATHADNSEQFIGLATVLSMCWMSSFAGVYLESVFKNSSCDIWLQNIRLSVITMPFAFLTVLNDRAVLQQHGFFYGWSWLVWFISTSSAVSGIVVAVVMKYADNIKKSYCQSIALGGTAVLSVITGDSTGTFLLFLGVSLVIVSVLMYSFYPPAKTAQNHKVITADLKGPISIKSEHVMETRT